MSLYVKPLPGNLGSWFLVCSLILTQLEDFFWKMEDDLKNSFETIKSKKKYF
jgi:hypothetical protein